MKLKALIVDNDAYSALSLRLFLEKTFTDIKIIATSISLNETLKLINEETIDILFLDIEIQNGTGLDLLEIIESTKIYVILTTAKSEYAIKAIKRGARDFLLKPIDNAELLASVKKAKDHFSDSQKHRFVDWCKPTLPVSTQKGIFLLHKEDIVYIKADGRYSEVFCKDERHYTICKNIGLYEDELSSDFFFRIHKSFLINCRHILKINSVDGGFVEMSNHKEIEISKRKRSEFLKFLK